MAEKVKENKMMMEFGKWLMDVAKYVLTAVLKEKIIWNQYLWYTQ